MKKLIWRLVVSIAFNVLLVLAVIWKYPPDVKFGYFFQQVFLGMIYLAMGMGVLLLNLKPRSIFHSIALVGNSFFLYVFVEILGHLRETWQSGFMLIPLIGLAMFVKLLMEAYHHYIAFRNENL